MRPSAEKLDGEPCTRHRFLAIRRGNSAAGTTERYFVFLETIYRRKTRFAADLRCPRLEVFDRSVNRLKRGRDRARLVCVDNRSGDDLKIPLKGRIHYVLGENSDFIDDKT